MNLDFGEKRDFLRNSFTPFAPTLVIISRITQKKTQTRAVYQMFIKSLSRLYKIFIKSLSIFLQILIYISDEMPNNEMYQK